MVLLLGLAGCAKPMLVPDATTPQPVVDLPTSFSAIDSATVYDPLRWWTSYEDPALDRLIDTVLAANFDLVEAVARVDEARARAATSQAGLLPSLNADGSVVHSDVPLNAGQFAAFGGGGPGGDQGGDPNAPAQDTGPDRISFTTTSLSAALQYEVDFWGRIRGEAKAAIGDVYASLADLHTARLTVLSQVVTTYFEVADLRQQIALTIESLSVLGDRLSVTEDRYQRGLVTSFELYQLRQEFRSAQALLPQLERQHANAESRLAVLAGLYPSQLDALIPERPQPRLAEAAIPTGLPSELLIQRPDVRAAAYRFESARYRIGVARAQLFPTISLGGSLGLQSNEIADLFDPGQWVANLTAGLTAPLFQGGRLRANVDASEAAFRRLGAAYARSVLTAYSEVESAMAAHEEERQRYALITDQLAEARASLTLQLGRYERGVGTLTDYLDALRAEVNVRTQLASAGRALALARLDVHRALGGGWTDGGIQPSIELVEGDVTTAQPLDDVTIRPAIPLLRIPDIASTQD
ncbi:MAG: TolC family protein [Bacteroidota bacterium]